MNGDTMAHTHKEFNEISTNEEFKRVAFNFCAEERDHLLENELFLSSLGMDTTPTNEERSYIAERQSEADDLKNGGAE